MKTRYRLAFSAAALACGLALTNAPARANLDTVIGARAVVPNKPISDCSARAKSALTSVMNSAFEAGDGSGQWIGVTRIGGSASASAVIECHTLDTGYVASFTCSVQIPPNPDTASGLCTKLSTAFNAASTAMAGGVTWY